MKTSISFNSYIEESIIKNWTHDALTDYKGITLQFHDVARKIEKIHIMFENCGLQKGDKVAICGRNSAMWAVAFLATLTYGAVAVPILHEFHNDQIHNIVNHSEAKLLFVGDIVAKQIDGDQMPDLEGIFYLPDLSLMESRSEKLTYAREHLNLMFGSKYPNSFTPKDVKYHHDMPEELAMINYTSGTTGFSKGVMLPYRSISGNLEFIVNKLGTKVPSNSNMLSILPMAHMYGSAVHFFLLPRLSSVLPHPSSVSGYHRPGICRRETVTDCQRATHCREDYPQEGVPRHTVQPHETAAQYACHLQEGEGAYLRTGERGFRW